MIRYKFMEPFDQIPLFQGLRVLTLGLVAFLFALSTTPLFTKFLDKYALRKQLRTAESAPVFHQFHEKKAGTPTMGGVIVWGTVMLLAAFFWILNLIFDGFWSNMNFINRAETYLPLAAILGAGILGFVDDLLGVFKIGPKGGGLRVSHKILLYTGIAILGAWWFYYKLGAEFTFISVPFLDSHLSVGAWYIPFSIFIIVASAFSANETDGLDGLLGGVSLFAFGALTVVAFALGRYDLAAFLSVVMGALLAFLWFNIYPARFFMGDTGSMAIGITLGVVALLTHTELLLPLFGIILVLESASVIIQMTSKKLFGKKIFLSTPIHHHFEAIGWHESQITMRFWIVSAVFSGLGVVIFFLSRIYLGI
ncbi:MAG: phospho-N-acetylmuramoyl-pentapeptide-transferase [Candidatus Liptonbacteria bacterium]|nr:phospho-N-acetylmuramoyl-pentapeptide-transferase [Candidatus Liptonbacteria bacterium]